MMRLYIVRHGETPWNTELRLQGQTDISLNERGRSLAAATALALETVPFDLAITSPLSRAVETAKIILGKRHVPILADCRIQEISFGEMEGRRITKEERNDPGSRFFSFFHAPSRYCPPEGGESLDQLCARTADFLEELKTKTEWMDQTILISTHGAATRALQCHIAGRDRARFWDTGVPKNCAVSIVDLEEGAWIMKEQDVVYYEDV